MNLTSTIGRRVVMGASLAAAAILLPTAALAASGSPASPSALAPSCTAAHTQVWYAVPGDGAAGSSFFDFELSNIGHSTCSFEGFPGVSTLNSHRVEVGLPATRTGSGLGINLAPGGTVHFILRVVDAGNVGGCTPTDTTSIRVFPPGQRHAAILDFASQACPGKSVLSVDSVHPGVGIPGFTSK